MKSIYLTISLLLCVFTSYAEILEVTNMDEVFAHFNDANARTLAIFDVDMVLVQPSHPAFQMANMKHFWTISKRIMKEIPVEKQMLFLSLMTTSFDPILIDNRTPQYLQQLVQKGIPVMALTANLTGSFGSIPNMEQWRINNLRCLGIDFSKGAPYNSPLVFNDLASYRGHYSSYLDGALFVNGTVVSKGEALIAFLRKTQISPHTIIFVDDREENVKNVGEAVKQFDPSIAYQGIHFMGAQKYPSQLISEEEFELEWQKLALKARELN